MPSEMAMFVGAYWPQRQESREQAAERIARCLNLLSSRDPALATWFMKSRKKPAAAVPLHPGPQAVASHLKVNRRDVGRDVMAELGFSLAAWNGSDVSLDVTIGAVSPFVLNSAVLSFRGASPTSRRAPGDWRDLIDAAIDAFDPEHAVVTSTDLLTRKKAPKPWHVGWLTYDLGGEVMEHLVMG